MLKSAFSEGQLSGAVQEALGRLSLKRKRYKILILETLMFRQQQMKLRKKNVSTNKGWGPTVEPESTHYLKDRREEPCKVGCEMKIGI